MITMEIDIKNFKYNIESIKKYVGSKVIAPVIKANAYGTYLNERIDILNMFEIVCVARIDEAIHIRSVGYKKEILIINQPSICDIDDIYKYDITFGISSFEFLDELLKTNKKYKVHLEIETGMNRTGIKSKDLNGFLDKLNSNIIVEGVYTHLSSADSDSDYTKMQLSIFSDCVNIIKEKYPNIKYIHSNASNGLLNYNNEITNMVRPGIIMYGYPSFDGVSRLIDIKPVCKLKTKVTFIKSVSSGESISYSRTFIAPKDMKIATIPIGYADGLRRSLSNKGYVLIHGKKAKIVGSICMDSTMIDVSDIDNVCLEDEVFIWDNENITLEEIASMCETINYEILCGISTRVKRIFINED